jgi:hypothetical protein
VTIQQSAARWKRASRGSGALYVKETYETLFLLDFVSRRATYGEPEVVIASSPR